MEPQAYIGYSQAATPVSAENTGAMIGDQLHPRRAEHFQRKAP